GETIHGKILPVTGQGVLDISKAVAGSVPFNRRAIRPYAPGNLKLDDVSYPTSVASKDVVVSWAHRDRVQQTDGNLLDHTFGNIGPETGTTYTLHVVDEYGAVQETIAGITGTSQSIELSLASKIATVNVFSVRNGYFSQLPASHTFIWPGRSFLKYSEEISLSSPEGWWRLGEASGTSAVDNSGHSHTGTYTNSPTLGVSGLLEDGDTNTAVGFDGSADYINVPTSAALSLTQAVEFILTANTIASTYGRLVVGIHSGTASFGGFYICLLNTGLLAFGSKNASGTWAGGVAKVIDINKVYHVVIEWDGFSPGNGIRMYLNGEQVSSGTVATAWSIGSHALRIAKSLDTWWGLFSGTLDEVAVYTAPLKGIACTRHAVAAFGQNYYGDVKRRYPVAYWRLGEASGTTAIDEMEFYPGVYVNNPALGSSGLLSHDDDKAAVFTRTLSQYVAISDVAVIQNSSAAFTLEAIVTPTSLPADSSGAEQQVIITLGSAPELVIGHDGTNPVFIAGFRSGASEWQSLSGVTALSSGIRYHVVVTFDGTTCSLYVDGVLDSTLSAAGKTTYLAGDVSCTLAGLKYLPGGSTDRHLNGKLDEVSVYSVALTATNVADHYVRGIADYYTLVNQATPTAYWRLGEASGTTAIDSMGSHDGTFVNSPTLAVAGLLENETNTAVQFDGTNDHVLLDNTGAMSTLHEGDYTLEAWIKLDTLPGGTYPAYNSRYAITVKEGSPIGMYVLPTGALEVTRWHSDVTSTSASSASTSTYLVAGAKYHVAATVDKTNGVLAVYINGAQVGTANFTAGQTALANSNPWAIGVGKPSTPTADHGWPLDGTLDEVAVYNKVLHKDQLLQHYRKGIL
ncbi:LamG domain-containing protein, partial [Candidatus Saccharibacteria bacterium]|nr:LamG domain-containing protein [Candidatus Saccharibacteria bacterium]